MMKKQLLLPTFLALATIATGCTPLKNLTQKKDDVVLRATMSESEYYAAAQDALNNARYNLAAEHLNNLRTFYPTGRYAKQALLDLIYVRYMGNDFEAVTNATAQFLQACPTSPEAAYALYAQGVTHMQGSPKQGRIFKLDQSERDTAYLRLAFADFSTLLNRYPNSPYTADVALRMTDIYNQFAAHELQAAYWYVKRGAYVAATNRARWVFQYYPQSTSVPEAIAVLVYSNDKLGLTSTANDYKTLLKINYPNYLTNNGQVRLPRAEITPWQKTLSAVSFGKLGRISTVSHDGTSTYNGQTRTQLIENARNLRLPSPEQTAKAGDNLNNTPQARTFALGLPASSETLAEMPNSSQAVAQDAVPSVMP